MAGLGPVLVMAGPGSGKTRVLTQRVAYLIGRMGVRPYNILAVTFTNKAAREMENRVLNLLGESARGVTLGTFHAICARILRREAENLPFNSNFVIFDEDAQLGIVKRVIADLNLDDRAKPTSDGGTIRHDKPTDELEGAAEAIVDLKVHKRQIEASAKVVQTADAVLGFLLDVRA